VLRFDYTSQSDLSSIIELLVLFIESVKEKLTINSGFWK